MLRFFRSIRQRLFLLRQGSGGRVAEGKVSRYIGYATGEIVLIVVGILLALQISEWNQQRKNNAFEVEILENLRDDFVMNQGLLRETISVYETTAEGTNKLADIIGPEPKPFNKAEIHEMMVALTLSPKYQPSDGVILSILDSDTLSLIRNSEIRHLIRSWPSRIKDYEYFFQVVYDKREQNVLPFLSRHFAFKNVDSLHGSGEESNSFEVDYSDLLSNRELSNHVVLRKVNAGWLMESAKSLSEYQLQLLEALEKELAP